jgi:hypothetical protein
MSGDETEVEEREVYSRKEMMEVMHRLSVAEQNLEELREKNAELQAINDAYAKRLDDKELDKAFVIDERIANISPIPDEDSDEELVTRAPKKAKVEDDDVKDEVKPKEVKGKRCGNCKKTGHNARTCKN